MTARHIKTIRELIIELIQYPLDADISIFSATEDREKVNGQLAECGVYIDYVCQDGMKYDEHGFVDIHLEPMLDLKGGQRWVTYKD